MAEPFFAQSASPPGGDFSGRGAADLSPGEWVRRLKRPADGRGATAVAIVDDQDRTIGALRPIDARLAASAGAIELLTAWRQAAMTSFFSQFTATPERTARWLERYLDDDSRLLLFVCDESDDPLGHLGLCNLTARAAEIDAVLRGRAGGRAGMMFFAQRSLQAWAFAALGLCELTLRVFQGNARAVRLYESLGFAIERVVPLRREERADEIRFVEDPTIPPASAEKTLLQMSLTKEVFLSRNSRLDAA